MDEDIYYEEPDVIGWQVKLSVALDKLSPTAATDAGTCKAQQEVVELNEKIRLQKDSTYDWNYQSFVSWNNIARIVDEDCQKRTKNHTAFVQAGSLAVDMAKNKSISNARLRNIAAELIFNYWDLREFPPVSSAVTKREAQIAVTQTTTAVQLLVRALGQTPEAAQGQKPGNCSPPWQKGLATDSAA